MNRHLSEDTLIKHLFGLIGDTEDYAGEIVDKAEIEKHIADCEE